MGVGYSAKVFIVVLLVVLAGCSGDQTQQEPLSETTTSAPSTTVTESPTPTATDPVTETELSTPTATPEANSPLRENPWAANPVVIKVQNGVNDSRDFVPLVHRAAQYWNENATTYSEFRVNFTVDQSATNPEILLNVTDTIQTCGHKTDTDDYLGCAQVYQRVGHAVGEETEVRVLSGQTNATTVRTIKHELGHTLGLRHEDSDELPLMTAVDEDATALPIQNATDSELPFGNATISVYVDYGDRQTTYTDRASRRLNDTLGWFARGADGHLSEKHRFVFTDDPETADVRIRFRETTPCQFDRLCFNTTYFSPDTDRAPEQYETLNIVIGKSATDSDEVAWLVGWPLSKVLINDKATERPHPFDDNVIDDSNWWES